MNFINAKTPATRTGVATGTAADVKGTAVELTMYKEAPSGEVSVEEFEKYALDRLRGAYMVAQNRVQSTSAASSQHASGQASPLTLPLRAAGAASHTHTVLKAIEEAKLRSKTDDVIQVRCHAKTAIPLLAGQPADGKHSALQPSPTTGA